MPNNNARVTRNNLFYSEEDFKLEIDIVMGYMEEDLNQTVVVYEVDRVATQSDDIYKDSVGDIRFKMPCEIPCLYEIKDSQMKSYSSKTQNGAYSITGNLMVYTMPKILEKYGCDIKRGDYIGVLVENGRMIYFAVVDDGKVNYYNQSYIGAFKPAYRVIQAAPVTDEEFKGI
jgi:hypothetical protein